MAAKSTNNKEVLASTSSNIVSRIHNMQWLKQDSQLKTEKFVAENMLKDLPSRKNEEYFSGTKSTKKKKEKKPKANKIVDNLTDNVTSDNVHSTCTEIIEKSRVSTCKKSNETIIPNTNPMQSDVANPWNKNTNAVDTLFPNVQSTTVQCMNEEEMLSLALAESIATAQLEFYKKETNEQKNPSNILSTDSDDDGGWGVVKRNLPDPEEDTDKQISANSYDSNNNDNLKHTQRSPDKKIHFEFLNSGSCKDKDLEGKPGTVKPFLQSSVAPSVENSNDKCMEGAGSLKIDDSDDPTKFKDMEIPDEKSNHVLRPCTSANIDKYGRVGGYTERHLFMGRGARRKEQEYFKEHGAALGLIKLQDQNSNRLQSKKSEDIKKLIKPSDCGFFRKSEINRYQEFNQSHKSGSGSDSLPTDFRYSRGNDKYSENRHTRRDEFSSRTKTNGEQRTIRGTGINLQKMKEQDTADSHNQRRVDSFNNTNRGMKFERSHEIQKTKTNKNDLNSTKNKSAHDLKPDDRSTSTPEPKENLPETSVRKTKTDELLTTVVPDTTTELMSSAQNSNDSLIQNSFNTEPTSDHLIDSTQGKNDANFKAYTDINNANNDSSKLSAQFSLLNDDSQMNHLPIASSSLHEQLEPPKEYYLQQSVQNLKDLQCLQYLQYLQQTCEDTKRENYNYPNTQSQMVQPLTEISPFGNSQYANLAGPNFVDPSYLLPNVQQSNTLIQTAPARFSPTQNPSLNLSRDNQFANFSHAANVTFPNSHPSSLSDQNVPVQSVQRDNMYQEYGVQANISTGISHLDYLATLSQNNQYPMRNFANVVQNPLMDLRCQFYQTDNNSIQMMSRQNLRERANLSEIPAAHFYSDFSSRADANNENCIRPPPGYKILGTDYGKDNQISSDQKRVIFDNIGIRLPSFRANKDQFHEVPQANSMQNFEQLPQDAQSLMTLLLNAQVGNRYDNNVEGNLNYYDQTCFKSNMTDYTQSIPYQFQTNSTSPMQTSISNSQMSKIPDSFGNLKIASNSSVINLQNDNLNKEQCGIPPMISPLSCMNYKISNDTMTPLNSYTTSMSSESNTNPRVEIHNISKQNSYPISNKDSRNKYKNVSTRSIGRGRGFLLKSKNL